VVTEVRHALYEIHKNEYQRSLQLQIELAGRKQGSLIALILLNFLGFFVLTPCCEWAQHISRSCRTAGSEPPAGYQAIGFRPVAKRLRRLPWVTN
jgi:hypothetical protein